ncbi:MAG: hypothetical protein K0S01_175 [Herbinix sp.]|jgi:DUF1680 family protein|nr:hypothetical protein [Herbinix sp.]
MQKLTVLPLKQIRIDDSFWNKYVKLVPDVIIPHQWDILNDKVEDAEPSHSIKNFEITANLKEGYFHGVVFQDTDVAKWLEAVAFSLASRPDTSLEETADEVISLIGKAQAADGYLNTYFTIKEPTLRFTNLKEGHELYTAGHMIEAAVAYYKTTGKDEFLKIMIRNADLICEVFSENNNSKGYPGHQEIELALIKLYEVTNDSKYLAQAKAFIDRRGASPNYFIEEEKHPEYKNIFPELMKYTPIYSQSHLPVRKQHKAEGHAVRAVYMYCAMADLAYEYQDQELLGSCERLWNNMVYRRMYITGSIGSSGILERFTTDYDLPNNSNYAETCASIGLALFGRRMTQITRDSRYMDIVEKVLYNTVLSGIAMDGKSFFYVNPLEVWPDNCIESTSKEHVKPIRQKWFGVACCPPNIARTLASLGEYVYFASENTFWVNLFLSGSASARMKGKEITITTVTNFPQEGKTNFIIEGNEELDLTMAIRIPEYVKDYRIWLEGVELKNTVSDKGYLYLELHGETSIELEFSIPARFVHANPFVREDSGKVAIEKGPLVYCLEEVDNGSNLPAIYIDTKQPIKEEFCENLLGGTTVLTVSGRRILNTNWQEEELYKETELVWEAGVFTAVPYCYWGNRRTGEMLVWMKELC